MIIREATESDIPDLLMHINNAYRGESSKLGWTTEADLLGGVRIDEEGLQSTLEETNANIFLFLNDSNQLSASVYLKRSSDHLYLGMLTVKPTLQGLGIGKQVLQFAEAFAKNHLLPTIKMTVIDARSELIAWYNRHGYLPTGHIEPWIDGVHIGERKTDISFIELAKAV